MPGSQHGPSIKNPKVYEALRRRRGMGKLQAAAISNAMVKKDAAATGMAIPPTGYGALFNQPGTGGNIRMRRRMRLKAANWGAKKGQTIAGNLKRGEGGRFTGGGGASSAPTNSARGRATERRAARAQRTEERRAAREAEAADEEAKRAEEDAYIAAGKTGRERQKRRAEIAAARRQRATERRQRHAQEDADERNKRQAEGMSDAMDAATQPKGGGGGGGKKKPTPEEKKAERDKQKAANRAKTAPQAGLSTAEAEFLAGAASGTLPPGSFDAQHLMALGLVADTGDTTEATDAGRRALNALERGDVRGALAAIQDGKARVARERAHTQRSSRFGTSSDRARQRGTGPRQRKRAVGTTKAETYGGTKRTNLSDSVFAGPDRSFPIVTAQDVKDAVRSLGRTKHDKAAVKRGIIRRARAIGATSALPESWREKATTVDIAAARSHLVQARTLHQQHMDGTAPTSPESQSLLMDHIDAALAALGGMATKSLAVFKDASGRDRWLAITTTAYEDKDAEWITCKAIRGVVAAGDAGAERGPLRFWHVPGLDLGDCDYQASAFGDRVLIESGTFRSKAAARIGQAAANAGYQMSPGFLHARTEPRGGRFDHIVLFERSFVPPGRASNPYTALLTKEARMLTDEKRKEFEALASDPESRQLLESLLTQGETTTKELDAVGAIYKDAPAWAQDLAVRLGALEATVKAPMSPDAMMEAGDTEMTDGADALAADATEPEGDEGMLDDEGFADLIVQKLVAAIGPLLDLEKKMAGWAGEIKAALPQAMAQKDDELAVLKHANAALDARLKELEGGQPRQVRASLAAGAWADLTGQVVTKEQAAQLTAKPPIEPPAGLNDQERGAYQLIYGES